MDYRVLSYLENFEIDSLFIFNYNIKNRYQNRPQFMHHRTPSLNHFIKNIFHINEY